MNLNEDLNGVEIDDFDVGGTVLVGCLRNVSYHELVELFGEPNGKNDTGKGSIEWIGQIDGEVFTIYDWKVDDIYENLEWNVGAHKASAYWDLLEFIERETNGNS